MQAPTPTITLAQVRIIAWALVAQAPVLGVVLAVLAATGVLPLVVGRATRLASVLTGSDKTYDAVIRLGATTTTDDADGGIVSTWAGPLPDDAAIAAALTAFRGTFEQRPPAHSAKKIGGRKAYELARRDEAVELAPVPVTVVR